MKYVFILMLCMFSTGLFGQNRTTINFGFFNNALIGNQVDMNIRLKVFKSIYLEASYGSDFEDTNSLRIGFGARFFDIKKIHFLTGVRAVRESFIEEISGASQIAYNIEVPIEMNYTFNKKLYLYGSVVPTYNTYTLMGNDILLSYGLGLGIRL